MNAAYVFLITFMYLAAIIFGAFLLPFFCTKETFFRLIRRVNHLETSHRDGLLLFLVSPLARLGINPNALTLAGFFLTFVLAAAFWYETYPIVIFSIALFSGLSDMFDGILARASQKVTALGGALDGLRDLFLFLVISIGAVTGGFIPLWGFIWFFAGAALIAFFKFLEILQRGTNSGFVSAFWQRAEGAGKLSIDRIKFFFYIVSCLGFILGKTISWFYAFAYMALVLAIVFAFASTLFHAAILRLEFLKKDI